MHEPAALHEARSRRHLEVIVHDVLQLADADQLVDEHGQLLHSHPASRILRQDG